MGRRTPWLLWAALWALGSAIPGLSGGEVPFRDVTRESGLHGPLTGAIGHCAAWGDLNGDGSLDLYVGGFGDRPPAQYLPARGPVPNRLFLQQAPGRFAVQEGSPAALAARSSFAVWVDLDNDDFPELYVANNRKLKKRGRKAPASAAALEPSRLYQNRGGRLVDVSARSGACPADLGEARNVGVLDVDGDALLDLLVLEDAFSAGPHSRLLRNLGGLRFSDQTQAVGLPPDLGGLGLAVADVNSDDRPDFFVAGQNRFFLSDSRGGYSEPAHLKETFRWAPMTREDWPSGAAFGDLNRDGWLDLVLGVHHVPARNRIFLNQGASGLPRFRDVTSESLAPPELPTKAPHVEIQDFDNDGWPDLYYSCGWRSKDGRVAPCVLRNLGVRQGVPRFALPQPVDNSMVYYLGPTGDYDRDGRLDILLVNWFPGKQSVLLHNESSPSHRWVQVQARGRRSVNRMGIGAKIWLRAAGSRQLLGYQEVSTGYGYSSGHEAVCHFGLGVCAAVDIEVRFPHGKTARKKNVRAGQRVVIEEP